MTAKPENLIRAILAELNRVIGDNPTGWTVSQRLPAVVQASQLSVFGLLVLQCIKESNADVYPHKTKLAKMLDTVLQKSKRVWAEAAANEPRLQQRYLNDTKPIRPAVRAVVKYADKNIGLDNQELGSLGVVDVQDSLALLVGAIFRVISTQVDEQFINNEHIPEAVHAALGLGGLAGGLAGRREMTPKEVAVARFIASRGSKKDTSGEPEPKPVKRLRKTLKELDKYFTPKK